MIVDSFGPRGKTNICYDFLGVDPRFAWMPDAYAARSFLASQSFVDGRRIALMGWSHGAATTLFAVDDIYLAGAELRSDLRQRAVAAFGQHLAGVLLLLLDAPNDVLHHRRERGGVADPLGDSVGDLEAPRQWQQRHPPARPEPAGDGPDAAVVFDGQAYVDGDA